MTDICGGWYLEKCARGLPPLKRTKLSKKSQERQDDYFWCSFHTPFIGLS